MTDNGHIEFERVIGWISMNNDSHLKVYKDKYSFSGL